MPSASNATRRRARLVVAAVAVAVVLACAGLVVADDHTRDEAPNYGPDDAGDATFEFLGEDDHYPGTEAASVRYTVHGDEAFDDVGAGDALYGRFFVVETDAVDHSACGTDDVVAFGVDRGDNRSDGAVDDDLLQYVRQSWHEDDRLAFEFYTWADLARDPPRIAAADRIVLELNDDSGGPCAETTEDAGFYAAETFLNGTGPEAVSDEERYGMTFETEYTYVCECDDDEEAREEIGPPVRTPTPSDDGGNSTPTPTPAGTPTPTETPVRTPTPGDDGSLVDADVEVGDDGAAANVSVDPGGQPAGDDPASPTPGDGAGFGPGAAVVATLVALVLAGRRSA